MANKTKLEAMGLNLPMFPASIAGSLPKPLELTELRYRVSRGIHQNSELDRKEKLSTEIWVRQQERFGFDVLADGEMDRGDMVQHVANKLNGFEEGGTVRCLANRYSRKPIVKSKIEWTAPIIYDNWRYAQRLTHRPVKAILTGPYTLAQWSFNEHYASQETLCRDLCAALGKELRLLLENGVKIIQIDELAFPGRKQDIGLVEECVTELTKNVNAYIVLRVSSEGIEEHWARMQKWPVDQFYLDIVNTNFEALPAIKKTKTAKDVTFGIIDAYQSTTEPVKVLAQRMNKISAVLPLRQIWFGTDFGLKTCSIEEATTKLKNLAEAVRAFRIKHR